MAFTDTDILSQQHLFEPDQSKGNGTRDPLTAIDLFAGVGGLSLGFEQAGFRTVAAFENDESAISTFRHNHPTTPIHNLDLSHADVGSRIRKAVEQPVDVILAGPPCQGFSLTGPRNLSDSRNRLYMAVADAVASLEPSAFVIENVPGMRSLYRGEVLREVLEHFQALGPGFQVWADVLLAADYGVPQTRRRLFLVGLRSDLRAVFVPPNTTHTPDDYLGCADAIGDLPTRRNELGSDPDEYDAPPTTEYQKEMRAGCSVLWNHVATRHTDLVKSVIALVPEGGNHKDLPPEVGTSRRFNEAWTRYHSQQPSRTIDTGHRNHFHYKWDRVPTIRENARLQSFPDRFRFLGTRTSQNRQVGNAVPPKLAAALASRVGEYLG